MIGIYILRYFILVECQWLMLVILTIWEVLIERTVLQGQPGQIIHKTPFPKYQSKMDCRLWPK
jgi:hypothetical protein